MVGQTLAEANIRKAYDLNVVIIRRGTRVIPSPGPRDRLLPHDELLILATEERIAGFKAALDAEHDSSLDWNELSDYRLKDFTVAKDSPLIGQTIQSSRIRENLKGLVVGFERNSERTINIEPSTVLEAGDVLWVLTTS
jgi:monovalent cation:H+ antiporter-2, CPA2 family